MFQPRGVHMYRRACLMSATQQSSPRVVLRPCLEGGCLKAPRLVTEMRVEEDGRVWWPLHYRSHDLAQFTTGRAISKRDMKITSVLEVLRAARDTKAATLNLEACTEDCRGRDEHEIRREAFFSRSWARRDQ